MNMLFVETPAVPIYFYIGFSFLSLFEV